MKLNRGTETEKDRKHSDVSLTQIHSVQFECQTASLLLNQSNANRKPLITICDTLVWELMELKQIVVSVEDQQDTSTAVTVSNMRNIKANKSTEKQHIHTCIHTAALTTSEPIEKTSLK